MLKFNAKLINVIKLTTKDIYNILMQEKIVKLSACQRWIELFDVTKEN